MTGGSYDRIKESSLQRMGGVGLQRLGALQKGVHG